MLKLLSRMVASDDRESLQRALAWLYSFVRPHKMKILGLLLLSLGASAMVLLQPWLTKLLIDDGILAGDFNFLVVIALSMVGAGLFATLLSGLNRYLYTRLSGNILFSLRYALYEHLQTLSPRFYDEWRTGDLFSRIDGDVAEIQRFALDSLFSAVTSIMGLFGAAFLLVSLSWKLSLLVVLIVPLELLWLRYMRKKVERHTRTLRERATDVSAFLVETLPAMKFIQASFREEREVRRLKGAGNTYLGQLLRLQIIEFSTQLVPSTLTTLMRAAAFIIGGYWVIQGDWQLGSLVAFGSYLGMVVGPAQSLLGLYVAIQRMTVSLGRVMELRDTQPLVTSPAEATPIPKATAATIALHEVQFSHPGRRQGVLLQGDMSFPVGKKTVLQGPSGVGKSTLIDLLLRFYDPDKGRITLNGVDLRDLALGELRQTVAVVSQELVLFRGTLAENLRYSAPDASDKELEEVVAQVHLTDLIATMPDGIHSALGERGQQLSGGQKQRIAIARALLQKPQVLILDEATSAIDRSTEQAILHTVDELFGDITRIYITHREVPDSAADHRVWLQDRHLISESETDTCSSSV